MVGTAQARLCPPRVGRDASDLKPRSTLSGEIANAVSPFLRRIDGSSTFFNTPRRTREPRRNEELTLRTHSWCEAIREIHQRQKSERLPSQSAVASSAFWFAKRSRQPLNSGPAVGLHASEHLMCWIGSSWSRRRWPLPTSRSCCAAARSARCAGPSPSTACGNRVPRSPASARRSRHHRPVAQDRLDRRPVQAGRPAGNEDQVGAGAFHQPGHHFDRHVIEDRERNRDLVELFRFGEIVDGRIVEFVQPLHQLHEFLGDAEACAPEAVPRGRSRSRPV